MRSRIYLSYVRLCEVWLHLLTFIFIIRYICRGWITSSNSEKMASPKALMLVLVPQSSLSGALTTSMLTAVFTTVRTVQALNLGGSWWVQQKSLTFLVLREGETILTNFSPSPYAHSIHPRSTIFRVGFRRACGSRYIANT